MSLSSFLVRATAAWLLLLIFAVTNGALGLFLVQSWAGEYVNHIYKTVIFLAFIWWIFLRFWKIVGLEDWRKRALLLGIFYLFLTTGFEFGFFHFLMDVPWERLLAEYHIREGRLWVLVLLAVLVFPYLTARHLAPESGERLS